jgi:hypothetical protein
MERALKGDNRAAEAAIKWAIQLGLLRESDPKPVWDLSDLTDTELRTLEQLVQKTKWNG